MKVVVSPSCSHISCPSRLVNPYCMPRPSVAAYNLSNCKIRIPTTSAAASVTLRQYLQSRKQLQGVQLSTITRKRTSRCIRKGVRASFFGVGAPEALLVGVVALVVFGPKGLAQAVKSLGATLRTFSPTIREIASISNQLSSNLQEQIGLDEIRSDLRQSLLPTDQPSQSRPVQGAGGPSNSQDQPGEEQPGSSGPLNASAPVGEDLEAKIAESKRLAWKETSPGDVEEDSSKEPDLPPHDKNQAAQLSIEELEAELKRRREAATRSK